MLSVGTQFINLDKIATLNNGRMLSSVVTDKVWRSVMPRTDKIELEDGTQPLWMGNMIHVVLLVIAKGVFWTAAQQSSSSHPLMNTSIMSAAASVEYPR